MKSGYYYKPYTGIYDSEEEDDYSNYLMNGNNYIYKKLIQMK